MAVLGSICIIIATFLLLPRAFPRGYFDKLQLRSMNAEYKKGKIEWIYRNREVMAWIILFAGLGLILFGMLLPKN